SLSRGVNNAGQGAGGSGTFGSGHRAFVLSSTRVGPVGPPASDDGRAFGLNDLGDVVGSVNTASAVRGFVWSPSTGMRQLPPLPGDSGSEGLGINGRGETVGVSSGPQGVRAVRWTPAGVLHDLETAPSTMKWCVQSIKDTVDGVSTH